MREIKVNPATSLCCRASVIGLRNCSEIENEVQSINICSNCQSESPNIKLFKLSESELNKFFITLKTHETNQMAEHAYHSRETENNSAGRERYHTKRYCKEQRNKSKLR